MNYDQPNTVSEAYRAEIGRLTAELAAAKKQLAEWPIVCMTDAGRRREKDEISRHLEKAEKERDEAIVKAERLMQQWKRLAVLIAQQRMHAENQRTLPMGDVACARWVGRAQGALAALEEMARMEAANAERSQEELADVRLANRREQLCQESASLPEIEKQQRDFYNAIADECVSIVEHEVHKAGDRAESKAWSFFESVSSSASVARLLRERCSSSVDSIREADAFTKSVEKLIAAEQQAERLQSLVNLAVSFLTEAETIIPQTPAFLAWHDCVRDWLVEAAEKAEVRREEPS